jgi:hypothetical protein
MELCLFSTYAPLIAVKGADGLTSARPPGQMTVEGVTVRTSR